METKKTVKTPIERLLKSLESKKKSLTGQLLRVTENFNEESKKLKDKIDIVNIQLEAFKNKK